MSFPTLTTTARELLLPAFAVLLTFARVEAAEHEPPRQIPSSDKVPEGLSASDWQGIRAAYESGRHGFQPVADGWLARNPGQQWTTHFDRQGFTAQPQDAGWTWGLQLESYGFGEAQTAVGGTPEVQADGQRLSYRWDAAVEEWFINDPRGLEHGFTVAHRPPSGTTGEPSGLSFTLTTRGDLTPEVGPLAVAFHDAAGAAVLNYSGLKVWDANGTILASRFEPAGGKSFRLVVDERGARYPITIDPIAQQAYLKASNTETFDNFGDSVAVSGDTVVVGAFFEDSGSTGINGNQADNSARVSGAVYVFVRSGGAWSQQAYVKASNTGADDHFGGAVAVSGDTMVVGARYEDSNATGLNGNQTNNSATDSGAAYVFTRNEGVWSQQAYLKSSNSGTLDQFGGAVAVSGDTVVVSAELEDSNATGVNGNQAVNTTNNSGAAYVFTRSGGVWSQQAYLKASNTGAGDQFGFSVAVSGETVVIGSIGEDSNATGTNGNQADNTATDSGAAYVFTRSAGVWSQQAYLKASNAEFDDLFGFSVAVSGDTVVVGAEYEDSSATGVNGSQTNNSATNAGAAYVFTRSAGTWSQQAYLKASNAGANDQFGYSVAVWGDRVVIGSPAEDSNATGTNGNQADNSATISGAAYVFSRSAGVWSQQAYLKASNSEANDTFGASVAISDKRIVIGGIGEDGSATGVNGDETSNASANSGAAHIFSIGPTVKASTANLADSGASLTITGAGFSLVPAENTVVFSPTGTGTVTASTDTSLTVTGITGLSLGGLDAVVTADLVSSVVPVQVATVVSNSAPTDIATSAPGMPLVEGEMAWGAISKFDNTPSQVSTEGLHHSAVRFGSTDLLVNGLTFSRHLGNGIFANGSLIETTNATVASGGSGGSGTYGQLVSSAGYHTHPTAAEIRIGGLTVGKLYQVQVFMPYWDSLWPTQFVWPGGTSVVLQCGVTGNSNPDSVIGTFRASGSNHVIRWIPQTSFAMLAAVSVRFIDEPLAVTENNEPGTSIADLRVRDVDAGQTHTLSLVSGDGDTDNSSFTIVGNILKIATVADFETKSSYSIRVQAEDSGGAVFSKTLTVTVLDIVDFSEIVVEQPASNSLTSGTAGIPYGGRPTGNPSAAKTFTIRNQGNIHLILAAPVVSGGNADDFAVNNAGLTSSVPPGGQTTFSVVFTPGGGGPRSATLGIGSNDADEPTFTILLTGTGLLQSNDTDGDGLNDVAEFNLSVLGYDWQTSQPALVATLSSGANSADLFTPGQVQALHVATPLLARNPATGGFTLTLGIEKSTTLQGGSFQPLPFTPGGTTINGAGEIEFQFTSPDNAAFFRVQAK